MDKTKEILFQVSDDLAFITDGINAARGLASARNESITETEFDNAQAWIFDHLLDDLKKIDKNIRAEINREPAEQTPAAG